MTEPRDDDRSQARREAAALLNVDIDRMSPADGLRVDMIAALRLVIDHEQASVLEGGSADLGKLNVAVQSLIALLPGRELPPAEQEREDPRQVMWKIYKGMRERGELNLKSLAPVEVENAQLKAEIAALRAGAPRSAPALPPDVPMVAAGDHRPGPDDPIVNGKLVPQPPSVPAPAPVPVYDYAVETSWRDHVLPSGEITMTPMSSSRRYWGPV
jgi:hypothetical protein